MVTNTVTLRAVFVVSGEVVKTRSIECSRERIRGHGGENLYFAVINFDMMERSRRCMLETG